MKESVSHETYFLSRAFQERVKGFFIYACKAISRPVPFVQVICAGVHAPTAYTNGQTLTVNYEARRVTRQETLDSKFLLILGLFVHEFGHYRFTNFSLMQKVRKAAMRLRLYPLPGRRGKSLPQYERLKRDLPSLDPELFTGAIETIHNILEDGYIEEACYRVLTGRLADALTYIRNEQWADFLDLSSMLAMLDEGRVTAYALVQDLLLQYAKWGKIKFDGSNPREADAIMRLEPLLRLVDAAIYEDDSQKRTGIYNHIIVLLWDILSQHIIAVSAGAEIDSLNHDRGQRPTGDTEGFLPTPQEETRQTGSQSARKHMWALIRHEGEKESDAPADMDYSIPEAEVLESIHKVAALLQLDVQREIDERETEAIHTDKLKKSVNEISFTALHADVPKNVCRLPDISQDMMEAERATCSEWGDVIDLLTKEMASVCKQDCERLPVGSYFSGARFDASRLVYRDHKVFRQLIAPMSKLEIAIAILVDESGSMAGYRMKNAALTAFIIHKVCQGLGIPCAVVGHTETFHDPRVIFDVFADFQADKYDGCRILTASAQENNRDGAALSYVGDLLLKRSEKVKLLINVTDGAPAANNYCGREAEEDVKRITDELRRQGVTIFSAAIGTDKDQIESIYGRGYLDVKDLQEFPQQLIQLIYRYIPI